MRWGNGKGEGEDGSVKVVICNDGKPMEVVPLELIDTLTVECNKEAL
ncbi:MAG: hypothetical protein IH628_17650 [Proteobacteria bacterium]|nr:hypothetical protein [Pseudomonadota bacterium]